MAYALDPVVADYALPLAAAALAGGLVGLERELRGHPAGLRTHILVCLTATLLMLAATRQMDWAGSFPAEVVRIDPVRMAHGVLTGIGFLCGGVIFRHGLSVHGLTTAASLWITSALGVLFGVGLYGLGLSATLIVLAALVGLRWVDERLPRERVTEITVGYLRDGPPPADAFRALLTDLGLRPGKLGHRLCDDGRTVELMARMRLRGGVRGRDIAERLLADPRVVRFEVLPDSD
ncbi:MgtC/SapB family protein [Phenylobacterium sp.]|uniref:MgtC/SapB family protein n=1 Tax=Phenylobacterium sp. TaxID=1871053 RepID=UPI003BA9AF26